MFHFLLLLLVLWVPVYSFLNSFLQISIDPSISFIVKVANWSSGETETVKNLRQTEHLQKFHLILTLISRRNPELC